MGSVFDAAFNLAAAPALAQVFGVRVKLNRLALETLSVPAQPRKRDYEVFDEESGLPQQVAFRDYLILTADYKFGGSVVEPRVGDRIVETVNGDEQTYEILPVGKRPAFEPEDASGVRWLIHTKQVKV